MAATLADFQNLVESGQGVFFGGSAPEGQWPKISRAIRGTAALFDQKFSTGTEPDDVLHGFAYGEAGQSVNQNNWRTFVELTTQNFLFQENTGTEGTPVWTTRFSLTAGGGGVLPLHAATHQHAGTDEVATATPGANAIPKAGAGSTLADGWIAASNVTQHEGSIDHDALTNFLAAEHVDWAGVGAENLDNGRVTAANVTQHEGSIDHDALTNFLADEHVAHGGVTLTAGIGLTGGGTIAANRTFDLDIPGLTSESTVDGAADELVMYDSDAAAHRRVLIDNLPGAASDWTLLTATAASASATIDFTLTSGYRAYVVVMTDVVPATDDEAMFMRFDAGAGFLSGASDYGWVYEGRNTTGATAVVDAADSEIALSRETASRQLGNAADESYNAVVWIFNANQNGRRVHAWFSGSYTDSASFHNHFTGSGALIANLGAVDGVRFLMSTGNITSGDFVLYGIEDA